jgi:ABC-type sugar transport system permease subunit
MVLQENIAGWLMASPFILGLLLWTVGPMLYSLYLSMTEWDLLTPARFVGLDNYIQMFQSRETWISLRVTTLYALGAIPLGMLAGLSVALLLNSKVRGLSIWRAIYYLPAVLGGVAVALLWQLIFSADFGILNYLLGLVGITGPPWLNSTTWALPALIVMSVWAVGADMVIYLYCARRPDGAYEAAEVDGANGWRRFISITLPMISGDLLSTHHGHYHCTSGFHAGVHHDARRAKQCHPVLRAASLSERLPILQDGVCIGVGLAVVRLYLGADAACLQMVSSVGLLCWRTQRKIGKHR